MNRAITTWALVVLLTVVTVGLVGISLKVLMQTPPGPPLPWEEGYELQEIE